jgi:hypothetical protein
VHFVNTSAMQLSAIRKGSEPLVTSKPATSSH